MLQGVGSDPAKLDKFCKVMKIVEGIQERIERLEARVTTSLDQALGESFKAYREAAKKSKTQRTNRPTAKR